MTPEQYERWKDFSLRMARTCFKRNRRPYWWEIVANVEDFFDMLCEEDIPCIVDWDSSDPYPEGSRYFSTPVGSLEALVALARVRESV